VASKYFEAVKLKRESQSGIELIENDGWQMVRMKGSHRQFHHPSKAGTVTIAGKLSIEMPPGTLNSIFKQAGLKEK
jgi:predicted RNA binding protein YcfA (HicA-like mRNA interferase family)